MGRGIKVSNDQFDQLDRRQFFTDSAAVFWNYLIMLMSDSGDTITSIAERVSYTTFTVKRVRNLHRTGGMDALRPIKPPEAAIKQTVGTNPFDHGYGFSTWLAARLTAHLRK